MKKLNRKQILKCIIPAAFFLTGSAAMAQTSFPDFRINEGSVPGALAGTITADKVTGNYVEVITFSGTSFNASLLWNAGQFVANDGTTPVPSQLGGSTANQYGLYALYQAAGTFTSSGGRTTFNFTQGTGSLSVFLDPSSNTTFTPPATGNAPWTVGGNGDDLLIATGTPTTGQGTLDPTLSTCSGGAGSGINCGSFGATSTWSVTTAGSAYFTSPSPFFNVSFQSGQLNNFSPTGTQTINGSLDVIFGTAAIPEPASIALIGLGLMGLGLARRKRA